MEWTVVTVLVVLIGLIAAIVRPLLKWNTNLVENTDAIKNLTETMKSNENRNEKEHGELWNELDKHDGRITELERKGGAD